MADQTAVALPLPPFSGDRPTCAKCGHDSAIVRFTPAGEPCGSMSRLNSVDTAERLCRSCDRCGFHWDEAVATNDDAAPFRGRVPLGQQFNVDLVFIGENSPGETHVRVVHEPSGLHMALSCATPTLAKAAELPVMMFQALLDNVDAWGRLPLGGSYSPAAEPVEPEPVDCARCGETDHCACWHDACCTCGSKSHAACGTHPDVSGSVAHGRNCPDCIAVAEAYANEEQQ